MTVYTLTPTAATYSPKYAGSGAWSLTGAASEAAALADASPSLGASGGSYLSIPDTGLPSGTSLDQTVDAFYGLTAQTIPANEVVKQVRAMVHWGSYAPPRLASWAVGQALDPVTRTKATGVVANSAAAASVATLGTGAWQSSAPDGGAWTQAKIDALLVYVRLTEGSTVPITNGGRLYRAWVEVETTSKPTTPTVSAPSGSITTTTTPAVAFTYADADGGAQSDAEVYVYSAAQIAAPGFVAGTSTATWQGKSLGAALAAVVSTPLTNGVTYTAYVRVAKTVSGVAAWSSFGTSSFTIAVAAPPAPELGVVWNGGSQSVGISVLSHVNKLTANQAGLETDLTGWVGAGSNCTATRSTTQFATGGASLRLSSTAAGDMSTTTVTGLSAVLVGGAGLALTANAVVRAGSVARQSRVSIVWYNAAGALLSTSDGTLVTSSAANFTTALTVTATSPANAMFAAVKVSVIATGGASELHYFDSVSLYDYGTAAATGWSGGGAVNLVVQVQRSDDAGVTWADVRPSGWVSRVLGWATNSLGRQAGLENDYGAPRGVTVKYRARTTALIGGASVSSAWSSADVVTGSDGLWNFKALGWPGKNVAGVNVENKLPMSVEEDSAVLRPLDGGTMVVAGAQFGEDGSYALRFFTAAQWAAFEPLFLHQGPVLVQDPTGRQKIVWWTKRSREENYAASSVRTNASLDYVEVADTDFGGVIPYAS